MWTLRYQDGTLTAEGATAKVLAYAEFDDGTSAYQADGVVVTSLRQTEVEVTSGAGVMPAEVAVATMVDPFETPRFVGHDQHAEPTQKRRKRKRNSGTDSPKMADANENNSRCVPPAVPVQKKCSLRVRPASKNSPLRAHPLEAAPLLTPCLKVTNKFGRLTTFWNQVLMMLESFWDHFGIVLGSF